MASSIYDASVWRKLCFNRSIHLHEYIVVTSWHAINTSQQLSLSAPLLTIYNNYLCIATYFKYYNTPARFYQQNLKFMIAQQLHTS